MPRPDFKKRVKPTDVPHVENADRFDEIAKAQHGPKQKVKVRAFTGGVPSTWAPTP